MFRPPRKILFLILCTLETVPKLGNTASSVPSAHKNFIRNTSVESRTENLTEPGRITGTGETLTERVVSETTAAIISARDTRLSSIRPLQTHSTAKYHRQRETVLIEDIAYGNDWSTKTTTNEDDQNTNMDRISSSGSTVRNHMPTIYSSPSFPDTTTPTDDIRTVSAERMAKREVCPEMRRYLSHYRSICELESCRDRCGDVPQVLRCSCDVLCTVYDDCCEDFRAECTSILVKAARTLPHNLLEAIVGCPYQMKVVLGCPGDDSLRWAVGDPGHSSPGAFTWTTTGITRSTTVDLPSNTDSRWASIHVLDRTTGVVYGSYRIYLCYKQQDSDPIFIPYTVPYRVGELENMNIFLDTSYIPLDKYYLYITEEPPSDPRIRNCYKPRKIVCPACSQQGKRVGEVCQTLEKQPNTSITTITTDGGPQGMSCMRLPPLSNRPRVRLEKYEYFIVTHISVETQEHILEFQGTPWRKIRCDNTTKTIGECSIDQCAPGHMHIENQHCIMPDDFNLTFGDNKGKSKTFCTCLLVAAMIDSALMLFNNAQDKLIERCMLSKGFDDFMELAAILRESSDSNARVDSSQISSPNENFDTGNHKRNTANLGDESVLGSTNSLSFNNRTELDALITLILGNTDDTAAQEKSKAVGDESSQATTVSNFWEELLYNLRPIVLLCEQDVYDHIRVCLVSFSRRYESGYISSNRSDCHVFTWNQLFPNGNENLGSGGDVDEVEEELPDPDQAEASAGEEAGILENGSGKAPQASNDRVALLFCGILFYFGLTL